MPSDTKAVSFLLALLFIISVSVVRDGRFYPETGKKAVQLQMSESIFDFLEVLRYAPVNPRVI